MSEGNVACNNPDTTDYTRRCNLSRMSYEERLIHDAMHVVEKIPVADVRLTEVTGLLFAARTRLADYVDGIPGYTTHPVQMHLNTVVPK